MTELLPNNARLTDLRRSQSLCLSSVFGDAQKRLATNSGHRASRGRGRVRNPQTHQRIRRMDEILDASTEKSEESPGETPDATPMEKSKESPAAKTQPIKKWSGRLCSHPRTDEAQRGEM